jgi:glutamate/tyrosine decarboxylase-like PLP-dependent enzyme
MFSEISLPSLVAQFIGLAHNPNNICADTSRVGLRLEQEAISFLSLMLGFPSTEVRGHFTSGGTVANFEALHRARMRMYKWISTSASLRMRGKSTLSLFEAAHQGWNESCSSPLGDDWKDFHPLYSNPFETAQKLQTLFLVEFKGPILLVPHSKHYSWIKAMSLLGLSEEALWPVKLNSYGQVCVKDLDHQVSKACRLQRPVLGVVSVAGTTELGEIDPVNDVQAVLDRWAERGIHIWHHVDAAYGGFFCTLMGNEVFTKGVRSSLSAIQKAQSVTVDPHKLGYVPYSCGAFLCRDERDYRVDRVKAPYVFESEACDPGIFTIEGSRSATGAAATWLTAKTIGFSEQGLGRILKRTILAKRDFELLLGSWPECRVVSGLDTNVLCFNLAQEGESLSQANRRTLALWTQLRNQEDVFVSKTVLYAESYEELIHRHIQTWKALPDEQTLFLIRLCFMNPFFSTKETNLNYSQHLLHCLKRAVGNNND